MSTQHSLGSARLKLLRDGLGCYPEAMTALAHFRHNVFTISHRLSTRRLKGIASTMGVALAAIRIDNDVHEVDTFYEDPTTFLGAWIRIAARGALYVGVDWRASGEEFAPRVHVSFVALRKAAYVAISKALDARYGGAIVSDDDGWWVGVEEPINGRTADHLEGRLGALTDSLLKKLKTINVRKLAQV